MASLLLLFRAIMFSASDCGIYAISEESGFDLKRKKGATPCEYYYYLSGGAHEIFNNYEGRLQINSVLCII
jgi:hypothetical protein